MRKVPSGFLLWIVRREYTTLLSNCATSSSFPKKKKESNKGKLEPLSAIAPLRRQYLGGCGLQYPGTAGIIC